MEQSSSCAVPISVDVDMLLMANDQPGCLEPSPKNQTIENVGVESPLLRQSMEVEQPPNVQTSVPFNLELQQMSTNPLLLLSGASPKSQTSVSAIGSRQFLFKNEQFIQMKQSQNAHSPLPSEMVLQQPLLINKQSMQKEPVPRVHISSFENKGSKQVPTNKLPKVEPLSKVQIATSPTLGMPQLTSKNKRKLQVEKLPKVQTVNVGTQIASSMNKKSASAMTHSKVQTESFESVRAKLRESLAAALALISAEQKHSQATEKKISSSETKTQESGVGSVGGSVPAAVSEIPSESFNSKVGEDISLKPDDQQCLPSDLSTNESGSVYTNVWKCDMQDFEPKYTSLAGDMPFNNDLAFKDELLQENGLCWISDLNTENSESKTGNSKRPKLSVEEESRDLKEPVIKAQDLGAKIEAELFRLFGGVNKKYKEKGRSLLFNLKDPNNPELRQRVLSEEITPARLCSMTAEELASKQLTEWRIAKAEEFAQMVVLPESDVDMRRLVKKTHKGEFQVEVDRDETVALEVAVGSSAVSKVPMRTNEMRNKGSTYDEVQNSTIHNENVVSENLEATKKTDIGALSPQDMQDIMVDDLKDAEFLPPVVSLDEFMEALDAEPPFENIPVDADQDSATGKELDSSVSGINSMSDGSSKMFAISKTLDLQSDTAPNNSMPSTDKTSNGLVIKQDQFHSTSANLLDADVGHRVEDDSEKTTNNSHELGSNAISELDDTLAPSGDNIWQGLVQLNVSSLVTVWGLFKSGEKTSTDEWSSFLEIKGRVRLDAFEKFLQELHSSRSRAIMIVHFRWKEGSPESGRTSLAETVEAYVADERVGFAEPAPGVELYFCPPHARTVQMLEKHVPGEHLEALASVGDGLVGVVVWRRPHVVTVTPLVSPRLSSNHRHSGTTRKHSVSRKPPSSNIADVAKKPSSLPAPVNALEPAPEEAADDVPPGFGPRAAAAAGKEEDLPEFDFRRTRLTELIHRYGHGEMGGGAPPANAGHAPPRPQQQQPPMQPWDEDDDDIPEWRPHQEARPPQGPRQETLYARQPNPYLMPLAPPGPPLPILVQQRPRPGAVHGGQPPAWQPGAWWPAQAADAVFSPQGLHQGAVGGHARLRDWRSDHVHRS